MELMALSVVIRMITLATLDVVNPNPNASNAQYLPYFLVAENGARHLCLSDLFARKPERVSVINKPNI